jgi:hypothetical protein
MQPVSLIVRKFSSVAIAIWSRTSDRITKFNVSGNVILNPLLVSAADTAS